MRDLDDMTGAIVDAAITMNLPVGRLIDFGAAKLKEGFHRIVSNLPPPRLRISA